ncbi:MULTISPECIES: phosphoribosylanthranilate isomerase [Staphylococcus]|uniref:N-(5'-phosphoribosyl)anthranilate isomerase n=1 Tax=Staphylococcus equorum TaxID=246432 RepID=A0AAW7AJN7_9STAP|nr:phosphoribosylanthranilate isomerase [Staphylococcus equorum]MDK9866323.1 phosphoribosylanthranilate isomerase [Staphylococcus equorum]
MKLKFCGFRTLADVNKAKEFNIDAMGFIHFPKSKRYVDIPTIKQLTEVIPDDKEKVVIVVDPDYDTITNLIVQTQISTIQLHGNEPLETVHFIKKSNTNIKVIKALPATDQQTLTTAIDYYKDAIDMFIIDTPSKSYGGTGEVYDWEMLKTINDVNYLIAGGMNYDNIQAVAALDLAHQGYDIASGIETNNEKDMEKMTAIIKLVKGANEL